jgi:hypothetical protein
MTQLRTVSLPQDLCAKAERQFGSRFDNLESLLTFVLQEITKADARLLDQAEERMIELRLKDLGYL